LHAHERLWDQVGLYHLAVGSTLWSALLDGLPEIVGSLIGAGIGAAVAIWVMLRTLRHASEEAAEASRVQRELLQRQIEAEHEARREERLATDFADWQRELLTAVGRPSPEANTALAAALVVLSAGLAGRHRGLYRVLSRMTSVAQQPAKDREGQVQQMGAPLAILALWFAEPERRDDRLAELEQLFPPKN
jgi:hypothetical protein